MLESVSMDVKVHGFLLYGSISIILFPLIPSHGQFWAFRWALLAVLPAHMNPRTTIFTNI